MNVYLILVPIGLSLLVPLKFLLFPGKKRVAVNGHGVRARIKARLNRIREHREKENPFGVMRYNNPENDPKNKGK